MQMDITRTNLQVAFGKPGCPICRLREEAERRYVQTLLYEYVNDGETRLGFMRSQGLCAHHAWFVQANEQLLFNDGLKTAIIYESLGTLTHATLMRYLAQEVSSPDAGRTWPSLSAFRRGNLSLLLSSKGGLCGWLIRLGRLGRWLAKHLFRKAPAEGLLMDLFPSEECLVCKKGREREDIDLYKLLSELADLRFRARFAASDGLCLPHLRKALAYAPDRESAQYLVEVSARQLATLLTHLRAYIDKHRWSDRPELRTPWEEASWIRIVAFFTGEARNDQSDFLRELRRKALGDYSAGIRMEAQRESLSDAEV